MCAEGAAEDGHVETTHEGYLSGERALGVAVHGVGVALVCAEDALRGVHGAVRGARNRHRAFHLVVVARAVGALDVGFGRPTVMPPKRGC